MDKGGKSNVREISPDWVRRGWGAPVFPASAAEAAPPALSARTAILVDLKTGKVLFGKNQPERQKMASAAKMMTALLAADLSRPEEVATAHPRDFTLSGVVDDHPGQGRYG